MISLITSSITDPWFTSKHVLNIYLYVTMETSKCKV